MRRVALIGSTGVVAQALFAALRARGDEAVSDFEDADAVIHLTGDLEALVRALGACAKPPAALICTSSTAYYGTRGDEPLFEDAQAGDDPLARSYAALESAADAAQANGIRTTILRTGFVLDAAAIGRPRGGSRQFVPWIHIDDLVALYLFALDRELRGPINAVAPDYVSAARFSSVVRGGARTVGAGQLVIPARAEDAGFTWRYTTIETAMAQPQRITTFESRQTVRANLTDVFAFFCNPRNLEYLTPPSLRFAFVCVPDTIVRGSTISYRLRLHGIPLGWHTLIARWEPPHRFIDVQLHGPYALWHHEHRFEPVADGVALIDRVDYALPFAPVGNLARPFVRRDIEGIFAYRRTAIAQHFAA